MTHTTSAWTPGPDPFLGDPEPVNVLDADHPDPAVAARAYYAAQVEAARIEAAYHCGRPFQHRGHDVIDGDFASHRCEGGKAARPLAQLLAEKPALAGVGTRARMVELEVWCA